MKWKALIFVALNDLEKETVVKIVKFSLKSFSQSFSFGRREESEVFSAKHASFKQIFQKHGFMTHACSC